MRLMRNLLISPATPDGLQTLQLTLQLSPIETNFASTSAYASASAYKREEGGCPVASMHLIAAKRSSRKFEGFRFALHGMQLLE